MSKKSRRKQLSDKVSKSKRRPDKPIEKKPNPFELRFNKQKHAVSLVFCYFTGLGDFIDWLL